MCRRRLFLLVFAYLITGVAARADERSLFYLPKAEDARFQEIAKTDNEENWPFTVEDGLLACIFATGRPLVMFLVRNGLEPDGVTPIFRSVTISPDPFEAVFNNMFVNDLIADNGGNTERRLALFLPLYEVGKRLCDQPQGTTIGPGEL